MSDNEKKTKSKYEAPAVIDLGEMAKASGACVGGSGDVGACTAGPLALTACSAGGLDVGGGCTGGASPV
jgi:hypothetical protein